MNVRVSSKAYEAIELLAFLRAFALLRTDRDLEQKTGAYSFICTAPGRGKSLMEFWIFSKYTLYLSSNLLAQHCALKVPNP